MRRILPKFFPLALAALAMFGVACTPIGNRVASNATRTDVRTGTPNTLTMTDADGQWTANSVGPSGWTAIDQDGIERFHQGSTPRELFYDRDTGRLVLSSGTDIMAKGITIDPAAGMVQVQEFSTLASEPIRAQNEAFGLLSQWWGQLTQAQKDAHIADAQAAQALGDTFAPVLLELFKLAATGAP